MNRSVTGALLVVLLLALGASPAAADPEIGLSRDGRSFAPTLATPLFDPDVRWVPGDTRSATFYVRNEAAEGGRLSVDILGSRIDSLMETGDLTISARGDGQWRTVSTPGRHRLVSDVAVSSGDARRIDVTVAFAPESPNSSQARRLDLDFRVLLQQDGAAVAPDDEDDHGILPDTGAPTLVSLIIGLALVAAGTILAHRRREEEDIHVHS